MDGELLTLTVGDDGLGMAERVLDEVYDRGVGLRNLRERLERLYGPDAPPGDRERPGTRHRRAPAPARSQEAA